MYVSVPIMKTWMALDIVTSYYFGIVHNSSPQNGVECSGLCGTWGCGSQLRSSLPGHWLLQKL